MFQDKGWERRLLLNGHGLSAKLQDLTSVKGSSDPMSLRLMGLSWNPNSQSCRK